MTRLHGKRKLAGGSSRAATRPAQSNRAAGDSTRRVSSAYLLRNRQVAVVPNKGSSKPFFLNPAVPCYAGGFPRAGGESEYASQTLSCARLGLEHYNSENLEGDEHDLVEALDSNGFIFNGFWVHVNFLAKGRGATTTGSDRVPIKFFVEVRCDHEGDACVSCVKMGPGVPAENGCEVCPTLIVHPAESKC
ncbi:hypothetical protein PR202_gb24290 [Eleusine coracana subsp. coracana]|uniref:DUF3615 domain-containing protein n=1 Tax=Eleusine coracana subsp. coracana TaxID=191504 RepID=A0AAV5FKP7_ELECO|nr:hypothetical protein QOZ80_5BG0446590 [Eleusine coracana subsp. coracana]GJN35507.1 hypothetical protein PR202_gb24290 [Eleusine coracana subsp. coracana]